MNHTVTAIIDKLRMWCAGGWKPYDGSDPKVSTVSLRIYYDQVFIQSGNKVLESLSLNGKIKGIYKDDVLILIICNLVQQIRKIKFQIKTNIVQCLETLSLHIPVVNYNSMHSGHQSQFMNVDEVFKTAVNGKGTMSGQSLPPSYNDFVKLCLLDPTFPQVLEETLKVLKGIAGD